MAGDLFSLIPGYHSWSVLWNHRLSRLIRSAWAFTFPDVHFRWTQTILVLCNIVQLQVGPSSIIPDYPILSGLRSFHLIHPLCSQISQLSWSILFDSRLSQTIYIIRSQTTLSRSVVSDPKHSWGDLYSRIQKKTFLRRSVVSDPRLSWGDL